jgi:uncharacterized protein (TIGR03435 family)
LRIRCQTIAKSDIKHHVPDKTGLAGTYYITFYYTSARKLRADGAAAAAAAKESGGGAAVDPVAGMSVEEAMRKELGLRLEKQPLKQQILVLDHYEKTPTEN